jgi:glycosyltransferase involved in cell wall biosynthesis
MTVNKPASRILMTTDAVGGVWQYSLELAAGLCRAGSQIWLAAMGPAPSEQQARSAWQIAGLTLFHRNFKLEWMDDPESDLARAGDWLLALARQLQPTLIHLNGYTHADLPFGRPVVMVAHSCVLSWWRAVHGCDAPSAWGRYRTRVERGLDAADIVVAPTTAFLHTLRSIYEFDTPSRVIWNGRTSSPSVAADREKAVMTAGRLWDAGKNIAALAKVASSLPCPVWVAGEEARDQFGDNVVRLGRLSDHAMRQHLARALIFALPARYEPFGLTALEAAQAGCALVLGDIPTQRELWDGAALFVPPEDADSLERQLRRLLDEPPLAIALSALARQRARRFPAETMVERYLRAYELVTEDLRGSKPAHAGSTPPASLHSY